MRLSIGAALLVLGLASGCAEAGWSGGTEVRDLPAPPPPAAASESDCEQAVYELEAALQGEALVTGVEVPACDKAFVATSLGTDGGDQAASICRVAAAEAGQQGVAAVSIVSVDGKELATGRTAENCAVS